MKTRSAYLIGVLVLWSTIFFPIDACSYSRFISPEGKHIFFFGELHDDAVSLKLWATFFKNHVLEDDVQVILECDEEVTRNANMLVVSPNVRELLSLSKKARLKIALVEPRRYWSDQLEVIRKWLNRCSLICASTSADAGQFNDEQSKCLISMSPPETGRRKLHVESFLAYLDKGFKYLTERAQKSTVFKESFKEIIGEYCIAWQAIIEELNQGNTKDSLTSRLFERIKACKTSQEVVDFVEEWELLYLYATDYQVLNGAVLEAIEVRLADKSPLLFLGGSAHKKYLENCVLKEGFERLSEQGALSVAELCEPFFL